MDPLDELRNAVREKIPVCIAIPADPTRKEQLQKKLEEYWERLDLPRYASYRTSTLMKIEILSRMLEEGEIFTDGLLEELKKKYAGSTEFGHEIATELIFADACVVINDYCTTGGVNILGGTGLPKS